MHSRAFLAIALTALLAPGAVYAQDCTLKQMASLDMTVLADGRVLVPVSINGTPRKFLVDTGGIYSSIGANLAAELGLKKREIAAAIFDSQGNRIKYGTTIDSFKIGGNEARAFKIMVRDAVNENWDGILAPDLLGVFDVELDFAKARLNLFSQDHCPGRVVYWSKEHVEVPFQLVGNSHIQFPMVLDTQKLPTVLDTGATFTFLSVRTAKRLFDFDESAANVEALSDDAEGSVTSHRAHFKSLAIEGIAVNNPVIYIYNDAVVRGASRQNGYKNQSDPIYGQTIDAAPLILGMNVLRTLHVYIAYKERVLYATTATAQ